MLNPPLSLLSDDLLAYIVEHISNLPFRDEQLRNLSITDRAFTQVCQTYIFRSLKLGVYLGTKSKISKTLAKMKKILNDKPSFANCVRVIQIDVLHERNGYYAMSGTSQKKSKIQKFKNSTVEKKNISLVQLTNAAISLLNW